MGRGQQADVFGLGDIPKACCAEYLANDNLVDIAVDGIEKGTEEQIAAKKKNSRRSSKDQNKMEVLGICKLIFSETVQKTVKRELLLSNLFGVRSSNVVNVLHIVLEENRIIRTGVIGIIVDGCFP